MAHLYLVRHARPAASWNDHLDPALDSLGKEQAEKAAQELAERAGRVMRLLTSPLRRCQETARPLSEHWQVEPAIKPHFREIPSPKLAPVSEFASRVEWLRRIMDCRWADIIADPKLSAGSDFSSWRRNLLAALGQQEQDCVIFTHFVAINAALGAASGRDEILLARPDHCSIWHFENQSGGGLRLLDAGREVETRVN